ncbi:MAG: sugar phosphate isomerase/epimerase family protein [Bilifractor sp.]
MNVKLGICNFCVPGTGVFAPQIVKEMGLDGMSVEFGSYEHGWPLSQRKLQDLYLEAQQQYGITYPNVGVSDGDNVPFHARPGSKWDPIVNEEGRKAIEAADYMKIPLVFFSNFNVSEMKNDEDIEYTAKRYQYFCDLAGEKGIAIGCENPNSIEDQKKLLQLVDRKNFYLFFDSCNHACLTDYDIHEVLRELYPYYYPQMHVKDGVKGCNAQYILGTGTTGFQETIDFLKKKDYQGWLIIENLYELETMRKLNPDYFEIMREDIAALKKATGRS